eukprot:2201233-Pyramimonas_sp.AAC.1
MLARRIPFTGAPKKGSPTPSSPPAQVTSALSKKGQNDRLRVMAWRPYAIAQAGRQRGTQREFTVLSCRLDH